MRTDRADGAAKRLRRRRVQALLASGLVLGVGAAATLAAWNDSEHSRATFTAGEFGIEGSADGTTFDEHATAEQAATLTFTAPATALAPGQTVYAGYSIRTTAPSVAGTVQVTAKPDNSAGLGQWLRYGVRTLPSGQTCNQASYGNASGSVVVAANSALTAGASGQQSLQANAGSKVDYCFAFTLPPTTPNQAQGASLTARWEFVATSASP